MSILFRTKGWLTVNQLARAWAGELARAEKDPKRFEQDLAHLLLEDVANGRLDDAGPFVEGQRLGLRIVTPDFRAGFLEGRQILDALRSGGDAEFLGHRIVVMKEAALTFAQSHNLPSPSWWQNGTVDLPMTAPDDMIGTAALSSGTTLQNPANQALPRRRARAPKKFEQTKQAMRHDILQGRLTTTELDTMLEREISEKYSVSRDTARKARDAALAEFVVDSKRQNDN
jgi:Bacterial regulatory proteins, gntR family